MKNVVTVQGVYKLTLLIGFEYFFYLKYLSKVVHLYTNLRYYLFTLMVAKTNVYIMNNLVHVYIINFPNLKLCKLVISFFFIIYFMKTMERCIY